MQVHKIKDGEYEVLGCPINGYDWRLIRKLGTGTYALYDSGVENGDDVEMVIEEYSDHDNRAVWDGMSLFQVVSVAHKEILKSIAAEHRGLERCRTSALGM